ncbi:MAG: hypothetical protein WC250_03410 [Candidatus Paceibacterota bacterium]|jgi:hypothetical protein
MAQQTRVRVGTFKVTDGPSRELLRDAVGGLPGHRPGVEFALDVPNRHLPRFRFVANNDPKWLAERTTVALFGCVNSFTWVGDSGEDFILRGRFVRLNFQDSFGSYIVRYNTRNRTGLMSIMRG